MAVSGDVPAVPNGLLLPMNTVIDFTKFCKVKAERCPGLQWVNLQAGQDSVESNAVLASVEPEEFSISKKCQH